MGKLAIEEQTLTNIADAIREGTGLTVQMTPAKMAENISTWSNVNSELSKLKEAVYTTTEKTANWANWAVDTFPTGWRNGFYPSSGAADKTSEYYIRSRIPLMLPGYTRMKLIPPPGMWGTIRAYTGQSVTTASLVESYGVDHVIDGEVEAPVKAGLYYGFTIGVFDDGDASEHLTAEFVDTIVLKLYTDIDKIESNTDDIITIRADNALQDQTIILNGDGSPTVADFVWKRGKVSTPNSGSGGTISASAKDLYSPMLYVGGVNSVSFTPGSDITYRVAAFDVNKNYIVSRSIRPETSTKSVIKITYPPRSLVKYLRVGIAKSDSSEITDEQFNAVAASLTIQAISNSTYYSNPAIRPNRLKLAMAHQSVNPFGDTHAYTNRLPGFWGAYRRGFQVLLVNPKPTSDGIFVMNHENYVTLDGTTYTISQTPYADLQAAFSAVEGYIPTLDDTLYFCGLTGMEVFFANSYSGDLLDSMWQALKKYSMERHVHWLANDSTYQAILAKDPKAKLYFYQAASGTTKAEIINSLSALTTLINAVAESNPQATVCYWIDPVLVDGSFAVFADAIAEMNIARPDNVRMGVCNVNSEAAYVRLAPYMDCYHSDFVSTGTCWTAIETALKSYFPILEGLE